MRKFMGGPVAERYKAREKINEKQKRSQVCRLARANFKNGRVIVVS